MAYAAMTSLKQTIHRLLDSPRISIASNGRDILKFADLEVMLLQESLITTTLNALDGQIRDAACKLEDVLESHVSNQFFLQCENTRDQSHPLLSFSIDMQDIKREIHSFIKWARNMQRAYRKSSGDTSQEELDNQLAEGEDNDQDAAVSSSIDSGVEMVGLSKYRAGIKYHVLKTIRPDGCLIVLDDVWSMEPLHYLKKFFQEITGVILVTTRQESLTGSGECDWVYNIPLLDKEESWSLFHKRVFAEETCPPELEKVGKKIVENCEGLPLTIVTVADLLSQAEKTPEYWNKVAEKQNLVFIDAYDKITKVLYPSYEYLPQHLKACFLYMGVFLQNYEISRSKIMKLWIAEGFLEPNSSQTIEDFAIECLLELVDRNLVLVWKTGSIFKAKTCGLHSVFWHLANNEALKTKFFYVLNGYADNSKGSIKPQHRFCIHNNIILGIKDVRNSMASISTAHSVLCTGTPHQYPVPVYLKLRLIRVLDALTVRFYEFPIEVVKLIHLRYLALTYNGKLPSTISKLWNLQYLIVSRHLSIKFFRDTWSLPMEIWDMKELKHIQIIGSNQLLQDPDFGALLPNLLTLSNVSADSCTERVLKRIHNLKRLGIQIDLAPSDDKPFRCLNHISYLQKLESLKCIVVHHKFNAKVVAQPSPISMFPLSLRKLSLSGLGFSWEYMSIIGKLPNLEVLKLRCYAFQGPKWETEVNAFGKLKFLLVEDTDLTSWKHKLHNFNSLKSLSMRHCYKLEELPSYLTKSIEMIEIIDCNPFTVTWAKQMKEKDLKYPLTSKHLKLQLQVHSSWEAK